jgi:GNAT superfamily N-acetyltransferase
LLLQSDGDTAGAVDPLRAVPELSQCLEEGSEANAACRVFVGQFEGVVVGMAIGLIEDPAKPGGSPVGRIAGCYVEPQAREVGVGAGLIDALVQWFNERGCRGMEAVALPGDRSTKQLFETSGLKARLLVMYRELP